MCYYDFTILILNIILSGSQMYIRHCEWRQKSSCRVWFFLVLKNLLVMEGPRQVVPLIQSLFWLNEVWENQANPSYPGSILWYYSIIYRAFSSNEMCNFYMMYYTMFTEELPQAQKCYHRPKHLTYPDGLIQFLLHTYFSFAQHLKLSKNIKSTQYKI